MEIKKDEDGVETEPTVEELKAELAKSLEEKENYRKGLLEREAKLKELKSEREAKITTEEEREEDETEQEEDEAAIWDEASLKFQEETLRKTRRVAEEIVNKTIESKNEKQAIQEFRAANPDITDEQFEKVLANYDASKFGKDSVLAIKKSLERADVLRRFDLGEVIDPTQIRRNIAQENLKNLSANAFNGGYKGGREQEKTVSSEAVAIGARMRVSKEALEKEDDSPIAEIKIV